MKLQAGNLKLLEAVTGDVLLKKVFLKGRTAVSEPAFHRSSTQNKCLWIIHKIRRKKPVLESPFNKVVVLMAYNVIKEDCNTAYFEEHLWTSASKLI